MLPHSEKCASCVSFLLYISNRVLKYNNVLSESLWHKWSQQNIYEEWVHRNHCIMVRKKDLCSLKFLLLIHKVLPKLRHMYTLCNVLFSWKTNWRSCSYWYVITGCPSFRRSCSVHTFNFPLKESHLKMLMTKFFFQYFVSQ